MPPPPPPPPSMNMDKDENGENIPPPGERRGKHPRKRFPGFDRHSGRGRSMRAEHGMRALEWVKEQDEAAFGELMLLRDKDPHAFHEKMRDWMHRYMKEEQPALYEKIQARKKNREKIHALVEEYHSAETEDARADIQQKIRGIVSAEFDAYQKMQIQKIEQMEERLTDLKKQLETRSKNKEEHIESRVKKILEKHAEE